MNSHLSIGRIKLNPADGLILLGACLFTLWLYQVFWSLNGSHGEAETLIIQIADQQPESYSLEDDRIIEVKGSLGKSLIEVKQGKARFIHSECRNKFCVFHGWLTRAGDTSACLPNRISIRLQDQSNQYDALNY